MWKSKREGTFCTAGSTEGSDWKTGSDRDGDESILAGGHVLVEDIPGLGKTTMAIAFPERSDCRSAGCSLHRMYFRQT